MGIQIPNGSVPTAEPRGLEKISVAFIGSPGAARAHMASPGPRMLVAQSTEAPAAFCSGNEKSLWSHTEPGLTQTHYRTNVHRESSLAFI